MFLFRKKVKSCTWSLLIELMIEKMSRFLSEKPDKDCFIYLYLPQKLGIGHTSGHP